MKKLIFAAVIVSAFFVGAVIFLRIQSENSNQPIDAEVIEAITEEFPVFSSDDEPVIEIVSVSRHEDGFYVATIKSKEPVDTFVPVKVLLLDRENTSKDLDVILGPDAYFSKRKTLAYDIPESVIIELEKQ